MRVSSTGLPVLEYIMRRELKKSGAAPASIIEKVRALVGDLAAKAQVFSGYEFDQPGALNLSRALKDAQIILAATALHQPTAIVTNEKCFQTGNKVAQFVLREASAWLQT